jgi:hypothetical protein
MVNFSVSRLSFLLLFGLLISCNNDQQQEKSQSKNNDLKVEKFSFEIQELSDEEYPDNPNIGFRSKKYSSDYFQSGLISYKGDFNADIHFFSEADTILLSNFDLSEFIPTIPDHFRDKDAYLCQITLVNQEWNRNQVRLNPNQFKTNNDEITRMDISRNCLNAYLWEIIAYTEENGEELPIYHGWFDFPQELYVKLFEAKNQASFTDYKKGLEEWVDPKNKKFDLEIIRTIEDTVNIKYTDKSDEMYPLKAARLKKYKEIITPDTFNTMRDLQSDSTTFATFSQPGFYNKEDPRHTELGRFYKLENIKLSSTSCQDRKDLRELKFTFIDENNKRTTHLYFGGLDFNQFPKLSEEEANKGWKNSMGFGNHPFYEDYKTHHLWEVSTACYYGFLTNDKEEWLDSHQVGIDGPIIHWDDKVENRLHVWLLSFERHALVGHYVIDLK